MDILLFSNSKTIPAIFDTLQKSADYDVIIHAPDEFMSVVEEIPPCQLVYLDIQFFNGPELDEVLAYMTASPVHWYGIIDPKNEIQDVATLFHQGIIDYIPKKQLKSSPVDSARVNRILAYHTCTVPESVHKNRRRIIIKKPLGGWDGVEEQHEYSFIMMLVRVEKATDLKNRYGYTFSDKVITAYFDYIKKSILPQGGREWLSDSHQTLYLFPFENNNEAPILSAYSFILNAPIISGEHIKSPVLLKSTMILHLGNITYLKQERAGRSISSDLNFIFHAATSSVAPGKLYITDTLYADIPKEIEDLFVNAGSFEGHDLKALKQINYN